MELNEFMEEYRFGDDGGLITKFKYYDFEKKFIEHITTNVFSITKKARMMHTTNLLAHYTAWKLIFGKDLKIIYVNSSKLLPNFNKLVHSIIETYSNINSTNLVKTSSVGKVILKNGNSLLLFNELTLFRGYSFEEKDVVILEDFAFNKDQLNLLDMILPCLSINTKLIICSTPNISGIENDKFKYLYKNAKNFKYNLKKLYLPYFMNPRWTNSRVKDYKNSKTKEEFKSQMLCKFIKIGKKNLKVSMDTTLYNELDNKIVDKDLLNSNIIDFINILMKVSK